MRKLASIILVTVTSMVVGQNMQLQTAISALRNKELDKAKASIDAASVHESTKTSAKVWMYRGKVYQAIYSDTSAKVRSLDSESEEKALESNVTAYKLDKDNIYKEDLKGALVQSGAVTNRKATYYVNNKQFDKALYCYDLLENALPYDFDQGLKRNNITKEKLLFNKFEMYKYAVNKEKTMEYADKLIAINYKDPKIYTDMVKLKLLDKDTAKAIEYIDKGKIMFEDNMELINSELNIYMARKQTNVLVDKLTKAIEISPDNELLHFILGVSYAKMNNVADAEKEYLKAIELKSDYEPANYNLAVLYYTAGKDWNDKLNALAPKDPKIKEYETKKDENFKKAVGYFEASYEATKDKQTKKLLFQLCSRLGDTAKAEKYK